MLIDFQNSTIENPFLSTLQDNLRFCQSQDHLLVQRKKEQALEYIYSRPQFQSKLSSLSLKQIRQEFGSFEGLRESILVPQSILSDILNDFVVIDLPEHQNTLKKSSKARNSSSSLPSLLSQRCRNIQIASKTFLRFSHLLVTMEVKTQFKNQLSQDLRGVKLFQIRNVSLPESNDLLQFLSQKSIGSTKYQKEGMDFFFQGHEVKDLIFPEPHQLGGKSTSLASDALSVKMKNINKSESLKTILPSPNQMEPQKYCDDDDKIPLQENDLKQQHRVDSSQSKQWKLQTKEQENTLFILKKMNQQLRKSCLFPLKSFWNQELKELLLKIFQPIKVDSQSIINQVTLFVRLNEIMMMKFGCHFQSLKIGQVQTSLYQIIYPGISLLIKKLLNFLEIPSLICLKTIEEGVVDELTKEYNMDFFLSKNFSFINSIKMYHDILFSDYLLVNFLERFQEQLKKISSRQEQVLNTIIPSYRGIQDICIIIMNQVKKQLSKKNNLSKQEELLLKKKRQFLSKIESERLPHSKCLGCCPFFINNFNIYDEQICKTPFRVFSSISQITKLEAQLKDTICAMINSGGGVIMFDCTISDKQLIPQGSHLTEKMKESQERRITSYLGSFQPPLQINNNVEISFVPLMESPFSPENKGTKDIIRKGNSIQSKFKRQYISGYYVTRLKIRPSNGTQLFYWSQPKKNKGDTKQEDIYCSIFDNRKIKHLKAKEMTRQIKRRVNKFYIPENISQKERLLMAKPFDAFGHKCKKHDSGIQVPEKEKEMKKEPLKNGTNRLMTQYEDLYSSMTLLIVSKEHETGIQAQLNILRVENRIEHRFDNKNLNPARNSSILYHNKKFNFIYQNIGKDQRFSFGKENGKKIIMIEIEKSLKLNGCHSDYENRFKKYYEWLQQEFPGNKLKLCSYSIKKHKEIYLVNESKLSSLWLYFILNHYDSESAIFRNPPSYKEGLKVLYQA